MQTSISTPRPVNWSARIIAAIGAVLNTQSIPAVIALGILTFFAFTLGFLRFGAVAGVILMLAIRPFVNRPAASEIKPNR